MKKTTLTIIFFSYLALIFAQTEDKKENQTIKKDLLKFNLNESGSNFIQANFSTQIWFRYTDNNPGTSISGTSVNEVFDIGVRRARIELKGQLTDKVFFYTQFGQNNLTSLSAQQTGAFFHDILVDYAVVYKALSLGGGLSAIGGFARHTTPSTTKSLTMDVPLYQQATNGANDQFGRKLGVYAKGKLGKFDYRVALSNPFAIQNALVPINPLSNTSDYSLKYPKLQTSGYFMYQFFESENNSTHNLPGTYLGTKKVFNIGAGFLNQPEAMWHLSGLDTAYSPLNIIGIDVFYDTPLNKEKGTAFTAYLAIHRFDFGPGYIRNVGVMNPANAINGNGTFGGSGNSFPMIGTGNVAYAQVGYLLKNDILPNGGKLQPFLACQYAKYERLTDDMVMFEGGVNWYIHGIQNPKISLNYQSRPIFKTQTNGDIANVSSRGSLVLQYQVAF